MPSKLSDIQTPRKKYEAIIVNEIRKLKSGYGISQSEMALKCNLSKRQFRDYEFTKQFKTEMHNGTKFFVK